MKVKDYSDRGVSLSNLPMEKLVSDLLNFWPNDVLIVTVCPCKNPSRIPENLSKNTDIWAIMPYNSNKNSMNDHICY